LLVTFTVRERVPGVPDALTEQLGSACATEVKAGTAVNATAAANPTTALFVTFFTVTPLHFFLHSADWLSWCADEFMDSA
jgi:hypothetical protein